MASAFIMVNLRESCNMPQTKPIVSVENVVASASVDQKMDLNEITRTFPDVEYHPDQFPGLVFRLKNPKTATLIFTSGKMVCTGSKSEDMARKAVKTVVQKLRKGGIKVKKEATVTIQNIVASINLGGKIHLEQAARTLPRSMYEPEQFPGLHSQLRGIRKSRLQGCRSHTDIRSKFNSFTFSIGADNHYENYGFKLTYRF